MNPVPLFLIIVSLPLLLGGCSIEEPVTETKLELEGVNAEKLEEREGLAYVKGSDAPYTGNVYGLYENGQKKAEANFKDGKRDGLELQWYENGQKQFEANFKDGKPDGLNLGWHENGQKIREENYKDGKGDGLQRGWHENGEILREANYKDGELISVKFWNNKGEPVDTYEEAIK